MGIVIDDLFGVMSHDHGAATVTATQYDNSDPTASAGDLWVKRTVVQDGTAGAPRGLLLTLTQAGDGISTYELSYKTSEGTIIRTALS